MKFCFVFLILITILFFQSVEANQTFNECKTQCNIEKLNRTKISIVDYKQCTHNCTKEKTNCLESKKSNYAACKNSCNNPLCIRSCVISYLNEKKICLNSECENDCRSIKTHYF